MHLVAVPKTTGSRRTDPGTRRKVCATEPPATVEAMVTDSLDWARVARCGSQGRAAWNGVERAAAPRGIWCVACSSTRSSTDIVPRRGRCCFPRSDREVAAPKNPRGVCLESPKQRHTLDEPGCRRVRCDARRNRRVGSAPCCHRRGSAPQGRRNRAQRDLELRVRAAQ